MDDFISYLENAFDLNFVQGDYNNVHRDLYGILAGSVKMGVDTFSITSTHFIFCKDGLPVREWDLSNWEGMSEAFRQGLQTILKHDEGVRTRLRLIADTPQIVTYQFKGS
ncbi:MAG: hypothetical protein M3441_10660 [Chloroflexota bacterium]|nr:hypothetical protein [Chloroflexota bacterium]